ncbi:MAG: peptidylprolyl isomerase, partial [Herminiimonas sp.]|nr:peptidylprolyl isomerase [Herminiimonas sp.]
AGFAEAKTVSRTKNTGFNNVALGAVMKADATKLPALVGVDVPGQGYSIFRINTVGLPAALDQPRRQAEQQQVANALAQEEMLAYIEVLKQKAKVTLLNAGATKTVSANDKAASDASAK